MSANEWASILVDANQSRQDKVPAGWKTRLALEKEWNLSQSYTSTMIFTLIEKGKLEKRNFRIMTPRGLYPTPHYKIIK